MGAWPKARPVVLTMVYEGDCPTTTYFMSNVRYVLVMRYLRTDVLMQLNATQSNIVIIWLDMISYIPHFRRNWGCYPLKSALTAKVLPSHQCYQGISPIHGSKNLSYLRSCAHGCDSAPIQTTILMRSKPVQRRELTKYLTGTWDVSQKECGCPHS